MVEFSNNVNLTYWILVLGSSVARILPLRISYALGAAIGDLVFYTWRNKRNAAIANMRQVLGPDVAEAEVRRTARASYRNYLKYTVDFLRFPSLDCQAIKRATTIVGTENLDRALAAGKGVIFVSVHFGHFDLGAAVLAISGYPVNAVVDTFTPPKLNELIQRQRKEKGVKVIPIETAGRAVLRALRQNEILGLLVDRPMPGEGVRVDFCGAPIEVPAGAAALALKTGAPIVPGYLLKASDKAFHGVIMPSIEAKPSGDLRRDIVTVTQQFMRALEEGVRRHPDQWYMFRHMWEDGSLRPVAAG